MYTVSHFHYKYRKYIGFKVYKSTDSKFHLELDSECKLGEGWTEIDRLTNQALTRYLRIGGEGLTSKLKEFDGTNYQEWASKMEAYLKTQELWEYVNLITEKPEELTAPATPTAKASNSKVATYTAAKTAYDARQEELRAWYRADDKAVGIIQLKLHDKLQYLVKSTSHQTWQAIKSSFDQQGPALIFVDFNAATNFQFNEKLEPAVQVTQLNNIVG